MQTQSSANFFAGKELRLLSKSGIDKYTLLLLLMMHCPIVQFCIVQYGM